MNLTWIFFLLINEYIFDRNSRIIHELFQFQEHAFEAIQSFESSNNQNQFHFHPINSSTILSISASVLGEHDACLVNARISSSIDADGFEEFVANSHLLNAIFSNGKIGWLKKNNTNIFLQFIFDLTYRLKFSDDRTEKKNNNRRRSIDIEFHRDCSYMIDIHRRSTNE